MATSHFGQIVATAAASAFLFIGPVGCADPGAGTASANDVRNVEAGEKSFSEAYVLVDSIVPAQTSTALIARISGVDINPDGDIAIADASEGNVKVYRRDGTLKTLVGRKGNGPGEFMAPRFPRFDGSGRLVVVDPQSSRLQVFGPEGKYQRGVNLTEFSYVMGFDVVSDGSYLFATEAQRSPEVLIQTDSTGKITRRLLPAPNLRPAGEPDNPIWSSVRSFSLAVRGDTAFLANTLSDSIWRVELASGTITREVVSFPGYVPPRAPEKPLQGIKDLTEWSKSSHMASTLSAGESVLALPFVQGILNFGDPMVLLVREPTGAWSAMTDVPPVIYARGDTLLGIINPNEDQVRLGLYARRRK